MLKVGDEAPNFEGTLDDGNRITLSQHRGKWVVLYFYPKDNTPGCTREACDFRDNMPAFAKKNTVIFGVSTDSAKSHQNFKTKYDLPFPLISDEDKTIVQAYGVWREKKNYGRTYMGIERTTFVIDEKGVIAGIFAKVKVNGHAVAVLQSL